MPNGRYFFCVEVELIMLGEGAQQAVVMNDESSPPAAPGVDRAVLQ